MNPYPEWDYDVDGETTFPAKTRRHSIFCQ